MSDSRLEKFIYAICSMEVSDLPVPLSRIEKLWNCLITGETPDFEPLSRNEKYLMAMLDRYDISNLPAPMSRGEKLLYKIAVGETDLSDVPGYLSRYEELLKYLIENGGESEKEVFNAISKNGDILVTKNGDNLIYNGRISEDDFEYVLYTLNQSLNTLYLTAEKPVKSAILSGNTLVNLLTNPRILTNANGEVALTNNKISVAKSASSISYVLFDFLSKPSTEYTVILNFKKFSQQADYYGVYLDGVYGDIGSIPFNTGSLGVIKRKFTSSDKHEGLLSIGIHSDIPIGTEIEFNDIMVLEGDYTNIDIPYFTGMQSVKMPVLTVTGKNLFDITKRTDGKFISSSGVLSVALTNILSDFIKVNSNQNYYGYSDGYSSYLQVSWYDNEKNFIMRETTSNRIVTSPSNAKYCRIHNQYYKLDKSGLDFSNAKIMFSSVNADYEPFKSNILTVNEEVELRGIGDIKDELNLLTGEVTQRIGEVVLDGSDDENWVKRNNGDGTNTITFQIPFDANNYDEIILDKFALSQLSSDGIEGFGYVSDVKLLFIEIKRDRLNNVNVDEFKQWLSQNPITVQYKPTTESVKTVDLTVVDQDNQPTELGTFENTTHVSLEAENLIPEVEMEVATRISTELASASPLMDDISTKQEQLSTTVDEQSNNVDATMIATTEIFEEIL